MGEHKGAILGDSNLRNSFTDEEGSKKKGFRGDGESDTDNLSHRASLSLKSPQNILGFTTNKGNVIKIVDQFEYNEDGLKPTIGSRDPNTRKELSPPKQPSKSQNRYGSQEEEEGTESDKTLTRTDASAKGKGIEVGRRGQMTKFVEDENDLDILEYEESGKKGSSQERKRFPQHQRFSTQPDDISDDVENDYVYEPLKEQKNADKKLQGMNLKINPHDPESGFKNEIMLIEEAPIDSKDVEVSPSRAHDKKEAATIDREDTPTPTPDIKKSGSADTLQSNKSKDSSKLRAIETEEGEFLCW